jgi:hypothetical protein
MKTSPKKTTNKNDHMATHRAKFISRTVATNLDDLRQSLSAVRAAITHFSTKSSEFNALAQAEKILRDIIFELEQVLAL